jgi:hypothetical protein
VADEAKNPLQTILEFQAEKLCNSPGAARLARLAKMAARIPDPLIDDLAALIELLDVPLVGDDLMLAVIDVAFCDARPGDATDFAAAYRSRLQRYVRCREVADAARAENSRRIAWWRCAIGKMLELRKWPAITLTETI